MSALDAISRRVEQALPVADQTKEKLSKEGSVRRVVSGSVVTLVVVWTFVVVIVGFKLLQPSATTSITSLSVAKPQALRRARESVSSVWKPVNTDENHLHGLGLGKLQNEERHSWEWGLKVPLDRTTPDHRPDECKSKSYKDQRIPSTSVVIIFCNEPFETLMRSVHSVLNTAPPEYLEEIVLVDDGSDATHIKPIEQGGSGQLVDYIKLLPPKIRLLRTGRRTGIVGARLLGIQESRGEAFTILDSHIEAQPGWLEALVAPIGEDRTVVVMPHIDGLELGTYKPKAGGVGCTLGIIWKVMEHAFTPDETSPESRRKAKKHEYVTSPTMAGGLFAANRDFFLEIGGYDEEMSGWGAENVEFSFRLWQCGGKLLCTECSRLYHLFGGGKHYTSPGSSYTVNRMRTMAAWMDEFANLSWQVLDRPPFDEVGNMTKMLDLRRRRKCKDFQWFLDTVWPESEVHNLTRDVPFIGPIMSMSDKGYCLQHASRGTTGGKMVQCNEHKIGSKVGSFIYWRREGRITTQTNDETCWVKGNRFDWCHQSGSRGWQVNVIARDGDAEYNKLLPAEDLEDLGILENPNKYDRPFDGRGTRVIVQVQNAEGVCLTTIEKEGRIAANFSECSDQVDQLWVWHEWLSHPFWTDLHRD
eukprot:Blabericola_migrator_1__1494@NODE_1396_length_4631_cov_233_530456_g175_i4_p1_GENE_NODE_1396_length_4631_cov_233_530456_g175_i4NODE_1396_length_4631_cov_233_530456_g175_i4_p1_ORF_typecomplete_len643_score139_65Glycos_transf_2/PF00535_26/2_5e20Glyco_tranf_2_3/PF13641_6/1_6e18Glyco_transf_7C/PF02709_14/1_4e16Glyco_tranf_2_2/PF10111_9/1e09Glyco_transf_21/PF13506_6/0_00011Ricin_B_lectin/PF00652_22/2_1Ricin_B_lectin/PF00652_22/24CHGN/PF05679_16/0_15SP_CPropep/PF08999_10/4_3SP_CPropep/PF08999_10/5_3e02